MKRVWAVLGFALIGGGTWAMGLPGVSVICVLAILIIAASFLVRRR